MRSADQIELVDITPEALRRRLSHGNVYAPERVDAALSNYFRRGNLTALRELALLWLADQVDAALAKYRAENKITDTWEARERVVVAVTGGPESETLVRRASRIASKSSAELMVVHVVRGDGLAGRVGAAMGKVRELAASLGATLHTVIGDDVPAALLDFAREMNATQLVLGTSRRSRWARIFDEGIGADGRAAVRQDRRAHGDPRAGQAAASVWSQLSPRQRHLTSWLAALVVPSAICAVTVLLLDPFLGIGGESALFFVGVLVVALLGGVAPAALSAVLSGLLLNYFLVAPALHASPSPNRTAPSPWWCCWRSRSRSPRWSTGGQPRARGPPRLAGGRTAGAVRGLGAARRGPGHAAGAGPRDLLAARRQHAAQTGTGIVGVVGEIPASTSIPPTPPIEVGDDEFWLLMAGKKLAARDRRVLGAVAKQAAGLVRQRELAEEAGKAEAIARADELRRSLLSAVSHDLRTPWPPPRRRCPACAATISASPPRTPPNCSPPSRNPSTN